MGRRGAALATAAAARGAPAVANRWGAKGELDVGGDMETTSGAGELGGCAAEGGAETRRDLEEGNCLVGERGEEAGEQREEVRRRRSAGEVGGWSPTTSSSGRGPRVEWEEEAEETPDMPDTDWLASCCVREVTRECWMAA